MCNGQLCCVCAGSDERIFLVLRSLKERAYAFLRGLSWCRDNAECAIAL
jgi:hypothetical protein